jgi:hypothetical protein
MRPVRRPIKALIPKYPKKIPKERDRKRAREREREREINNNNNNVTKGNGFIVKDGLTLGLLLGLMSTAQLVFPSVC